MTTHIDPSDTQAVITQLQDQIAAIKQAREDQPARLAQARADADEARGWALIEEPLDGQVKSVASIDGSASLSLPNITARELWGARLCFDILDCGDDFDQIDAVISRLFSTANGDTGIAMVIMSAALSTIASLVVPQLLEEIEHGGSNYTERVRLAEARAKAWSGRVAELRGPQDDAADCGVKPVDGFDIAANALDPEEP
jgi:multidrug efflux pump subunit AcrA (membrane-fusion protein)